MAANLERRVADLEVQLRQLCADENAVLERHDEQLATAQRALIATRNALANDVFPRLDRIETELQIDEQLTMPIDDVDVTEGRVL